MEQKIRFSPHRFSQNENEREPSMEESRNKQNKNRRKKKNSFRLPEFVPLNPPFNLLSYLIKVKCARWFVQQKKQDQKDQNIFLEIM